MNSTTKTIIVVVIVLALAALFVGMSKAPATDMNTTGTEETTQTGSTTSNNTSATNGTKTIVKSNTTGNAGAPVASAPSDASILQLISGAKVRVPQNGVDVNLNQGTANFTHGSTNGTISVGKILGKVATDAGYDVFLDMTVTNGNAAPLKYVVLFRSLGQGVQYTSSILVGEKVDLIGVTASADTSVTMTIPKTYMSSSVGYKLALSYVNVVGNSGPLTAEQKGTQTMALKVRNHMVTN